MSSRAVVTSVFSGSTPRRAEYLHKANSAARAVDCRLWHGSLESWREPRKIRDVGANAKSVYQAFNCCWLESTKCAHFAEGSVEQRHVFATQYNEYEYPVRIVFDSECKPTVYRLGLPFPVYAPTATGVATTGKGAAPRQYLYQFKDSFGNLSSPSPVSKDITVQEGAAVQVSGWAIPDGGWDIQSILIYRSVAGYESSIKEDKNEVDVGWMRVDEIPASRTSYVDTKFDIDLLESLKEDVVEPPPANLQGLVEISSMNCLAGFVGRTLYFTENNNYHNWMFQLQLDDTVRAIVESNNLIYVATEGSPYVVEAAASCKDAGCRQAIRMPEGLPLVGNGYRSMVAVPSGAVYPSHQGLIYIQGKHAPVVLTSRHYAPDDWQALHPDTAKVRYHQASLFVFCRNGGFNIQIKDGASTGTDLDHHTELSLTPDEVFTSRSGRLFLRFGSGVYEWDRGTAKMPHYYEAGSVVTGVPFNFGALQVLMSPGEENIQLTVDGEEVLNETIYTNDLFALPMWEGQSYKWALTGTATVHQVSLAPSAKEL